MGIPQFYGSWILPKARRDRVLFNSRQIPNDILAIAIDANSLIHGAAVTVYDMSTPESAQRVRETPADVLELEHFAKIGEEIIQTCKIGRDDRHAIRAEYLIFAVDGVAPMGKIMQQRQRRYRSVITKKVEELEYYDSNKITPGTDFMIRLDAYLRRWFDENRARLPENIIYSSHLSPGEGEHKIMDILKNKDALPGQGPIVFNGLDADLIVISAFSDRQVFLWRDIKRDEFLPIEWVKDLVKNIDDFAVITFLLGNDFLPSIPGTETLAQTLDSILDVYRRLKLPLIDKEKGKISYENLTRLVKELAKSEKMLLDRTWSTENTKKHEALRGSASRETDINIATFREIWYNKALNPSGRNPESVKAENILLMCGDFLMGMEWCYRYYKKGTAHVNARYAYSFYRAPMLSDFAAFLDSMNYETPLIIESVSNMSFSLMHPVQQLMCVLPPTSRKHLPVEVQPLVEEMKDLFPQVVFKDEDVIKEHHETIILPAPNPEEIIYRVNQLIWTTTSLAKYGPGIDLYLLSSKARTRVPSSYRSDRERSTTRSEQPRRTTTRSGTSSQQTKPQMPQIGGFSNVSRSLEFL